VRITADSSVTDLTYQNDLLHTVTDNATGRIITFIYDNGRIDKIAGPVTVAVPDGIWVDYDYVNGNLTEVTYPDGSGFIYEYDDPADEHNLTAKKDKTGRQLSSWTYDAHDRAYINTSYDGRGGTIEYMNGSKVKVTDAYGVERTYTYKILNGQVMVTGVEGEPDCNGCVNGCVNGAPIRYEHDLDMNVTEKEYANGRIDKFEDFDERGNARIVKYAAGTPDERVVYKTYHPSLNTVLIRRVAGVLQDDKVTIHDYDDPNADGDTDTPNENPGLRIYRRIERGFTQNANGDTIPYEYVTTYGYFDDGQLKSVDGPNPGVQDKTAYAYHTDGSLHTVTRPSVGTVTYTDYDAAGNVGTVIDVNGVSTSYKYDGRNRRLSETRNGIINERTYNTAGDLITSAAGGIVTVYEYYDDPSEPFKYGRLKKIIDASEDYIFYDYDDNGNRTEESVYAKNEDGAFTRKKYQRFEYHDETGASPGKLWKEVNPDDTATVYEYDVTGNIQRVTDAVNKAAAYTYDRFDRTETVTQGAHLSENQAITQQTYDLPGNLWLVTDAESNVTGYLYDDMGRRIKRDSPDTGVTVYAYDSAGNMVTMKDAENVTVNYEYDSLNRLTHIDLPDAAQNTAFTYDQGDYAKGRLTGVTFPSGSQIFAYDTDSRLSGVTVTADGRTYTDAYEYHATGQPERITLDSGLAAEYAIDADGKISEVKINGVTLISGLKYLPFGPVASMSMEDEKLNFARDYTLRYQPQQILATWAVPTPEPAPAPAQTMASDSLQSPILSPDSHIAPGMNPPITQPENPNVIPLAFTPLMTNKNMPMASADSEPMAPLSLNPGDDVLMNFNYIYYADGNVKTVDGLPIPGMSGQTSTYALVPNKGNRLESVTTGEKIVTYTYDDNGRITSDGSRTFVYNQHNRLVKVKQGVTIISEYSYNGFNQRIKKVVSGTTIYYHYNLQGNLIAESSGDGTPLRDYIYLNGERIAMKIYGELEGFYYFINDHLGTPQKIINSEGAVVWEAAYLPFGKAQILVETVINNFRFPGQYFDSETGLHYNWHRYYDPRTGRYLTADPIGLKGGNNLYQYANSNPIMFADPDIERNPEKAGLVKKPEDWPWSSALPHILGKNDILVKTEPLCRMVQKEWSEFLSEYPDSTDIVTLRRHERTGRPLGQEHFIEKLETVLNRPLKLKKSGRKKKK
jgi:RHS repeat-associated protein